MTTGETGRPVVQLGSARAHRRRRDQVPRQRKVTVRYSEDEWERLQRNADRARLAVAAWVAEASLDAPRSTGRSGGAGAVDREEVLLQLLGIHRQLRGACTNLNQAVARLNATGESPGELPAIAAYVRRVTTAVDEALVAVRTR